MGDSRKPKEITYNGETHTLREWSKIVGIKENTLYDRLRRGNSVEKALTTPVHYNMVSKERKRRWGKKYEINGESHTIAEWAEIYHLTPGYINQRISLGMSVVDAITKPKGCTPLKRYEFRGKEMTLRELSKIGGVSPGLIRGRIKNGWSIEDAVMKPVRKAGERRIRDRSEDTARANNCKRYDCLYQDGSGICNLGYRNNFLCNGNYKDAFEYYFAEKDGYRKNVKKKGDESKKNGIQYFGTGSVYIQRKSRQEEAPDPWARDRELLYSGYVPD